MAIVRRIAAASYRDTMPSLRGIGHALELRAEPSSSLSAAPTEEFPTRRPAPPAPPDGAPIAADPRPGAPPAGPPFDARQSRALGKVWDAGPQTAPRTNPG